MSNTKEFRIYKPNNKGDGAASKWQLNDKQYQKNDKSWTESLLFLTMAHQDGKDENDNAKFTWKNDACVMKLEESDIGEFLAVINGLKSEAGSGKGLYHETDKGNKILNFKFNEPTDKWPASFGLKINQKISENNQTKEYKHMLTLAEASVLKVLLEAAIRRMYQW